MPRGSQVKEEEKKNAGLSVGQKILKGLKWFGLSYLWIMPILLGFDIWSKLGLQQALWVTTDSGGYSKVLTIIPGFFTLEVTHNTGAAWSMFANIANSTTILSWVSLLAAIALIAILAIYYKKMNIWYRIALYLMIPGTVGNLIDRSLAHLAPNSLYKDGVIDFLKFTFGSYQFPTFNLADSYLTLGALVLLVGTVVIDIWAEKKKAQDSQVNVIIPEKKAETKTEPEENKEAVPDAGKPADPVPPAAPAADNGQKEDK
jgi:signal peptidase II